MHDRVIVDSMSDFEHSSSHAGCTFSMHDSRVKRGSTTGHKTLQARLPADYGLYNSSFSKPGQLHLWPFQSVEAITTSRVQAPWSWQSVCSHCHPRASLGSDWALQVVRQSTTSRQSVHKIFVAGCYCFAHCFAPYSCFAHCCLRPFIVRSASNLSTVPGSHSVRASVSMFTITDNCLFLFLFLSLFLGRYLNTTMAVEQPSRSLHLHRSTPRHVHIKSVYVRTRMHICQCMHSQSLLSSRQIHQRLVTFIL